MESTRKRHPIRPIDLVLVAVLIAAIVAGLVLIRDPGQARAAANTTTVQRGTVETTVTASGTVESAATLGVDFATSGTVTEIDVEAGDHVRKGQVLARVDPSTAQADLQSASSAASSAAAGVGAARAGVTSAQAGVTSAAANLSSALENLREVCHSDQSTDAQVAEAEAKVASARAQVAQAEASVASAGSQVQQAEASLASANAAVTQARGSLSDTVLRAPMAGTVVEINGAVGQSSSSASSASSTSTGSETSGFVVISDLKDLRVRAYFSETDASDLRKGQRATVTFDALGTSVSAQVHSIDVTSTVENGVVEYGVTLDLEDRPARSRPGQTATVEVVTGRAKNVLYVPSAAVQTIGGQQVVTVVRDGSQVRVPVSVGLESDQTTEITSGLAEGDRVVIPTSTGTDGFPSGNFPVIGIGGGGGPGGGA